MEKILKGKKVVKKITEELKSELEFLKSKGVEPKLIIIQVGQDPASLYYANNIIRKAKKIGMRAEINKYSSKTSKEKIITKIKSFNNQADIHGILLQLPLPDNLPANYIASQIDPDKDIDCVNPVNIGKLMLGEGFFIPCTPAAILEIIKFYGINTDGSNIVILGRSNIVGKPIANLLFQKKSNANATVTICHSHTKNLNNFTKKADILISAIGKPNFVNSNMLKKDSVVIDVGINRIFDNNDKKYKYVGDVFFDDVLSKVKAITPVPGGVGTVTTTSLIANVMKSCKNLS